MPYFEPYPTHVPACYLPCTTSPCHNPHCTRSLCKMYQWQRDDVHTLQRKHQLPARGPERLDQHTKPRRRSSLMGREIIRQGRKLEKEKLEKEARQKVQDMNRGQAERQKDLKRGEEARERNVRMKGGRHRDGEDSGVETERPAVPRQLRRGDGRDRDARARNQTGKWLERRYDAQGRPMMMVVTRQRLPGKMSWF